MSEANKLNVGSKQVVCFRAHTVGILCPGMADNPGYTLPHTIHIMPRHKKKMIHIRHAA